MSVKESSIFLRYCVFASLIVSFFGFFFVSGDMLAFDYEDEPYAPWLDLSSLDNSNKAIAEQLRMEQPPRANNVPIPRYPDAKLFSVNSHIAPEAQAIEQCNNRLDGILLVSSSPLVQVEEWYQQELEGYSAFDIEIGRLYIKGNLKQFHYPKDSRLFASVPHVIVSSNDNPSVVKLTGGYPVIIEIVYPPVDRCEHSKTNKE